MLNNDVHGLFPFYILCIAIHYRREEKNMLQSNYENTIYIKITNKKRI